MKDEPISALVRAGFYLIFNIMPCPRVVKPAALSIVEAMNWKAGMFQTSTL